MADWIEWPGGECPVDADVLVEVLVADHFIPVTRLGQARDFGWGLSNAPQPKPGHIIAYRLSRPSGVL